MAHNFELTAPNEHYHHPICRECHKTERLDLCVSKAVIGQAEAHGYTQIAHLMEDTAYVVSARAAPDRHAPSRDRDSNCSYDTVGNFEYGHLLRKRRLLHLTKHLLAWELARQIGPARRFHNLPKRPRHPLR